MRTLLDKHPTLWSKLSNMGRSTEEKLIQATNTVNTSHTPDSSHCHPEQLFPDATRCSVSLAVGAYELHMNGGKARQFGCPQGVSLSPGSLDSGLRRKDALGIQGCSFE